MLWIRAEVPLTTVRMIAGHATLATTDRYARIARNDLAGAAAQVNSYIARTRGEPGPTAENRGTSLTRCNVLERVTRIELALSAWEADVLPLNYTRLTRRPASHALPSSTAAPRRWLKAPQDVEKDNAHLLHVLGTGWVCWFLAGWLTFFPRPLHPRLGPSPPARRHSDRAARRLGHHVAMWIIGMGSRLAFGVGA